MSITDVNTIKKILRIVVLVFCSISFMAAIVTFMNNSRINSYTSRYLTGYFSYLFFTLFLYYTDLLSNKNTKLVLAIIVFLPYLILSLYAIVYIPFLHFPYNYPFTTLLVGVAILNAFWLISKKYIPLSVTALIAIALSIYTALWIVPDFLLKKGNKVVANSHMPSLSSCLVDTTGSKVSNGSYENKIVLLDFWFRGCKPCYDKMPVLKRIAGRYKGNDNVAILTVNIGVRDSFEEFKSELRIRNFELHGYYLLDTSLLRKLGFEGYPSEVILDKMGRIVRSHSGFDKSFENTYLMSRIELIDSLLNAEK